MRAIHLRNIKGNLKFISQFINTIEILHKNIKLYGLCDMYIKYKKKYDSRNIFLSSNSSQTSKKRKVIPSTQLSHHKIPTSITVPKVPEYKITHKEIYAVNGTEPSMDTMI